MTLPKRKRTLVSSALVQSATGVQLPNVPIYDPPAAPAAPPPPPIDNGAVFDGKVESYGKTLDVPQDIETQIAVTAKPWTAIDVYVSGVFSTNTSVLTISVYALVRGQRTLVAVGRAQQGNSGSALPRAQRVVALRAPIAERYEVTAHFNEGTTNTFQIAVSASDHDASEIDTQLVGSRPYQRSGTGELDLTANAVGGLFNGYELLEISAWHTQAAVHWLQLHNGVPVVLGDTPIWTMPFAQNEKAKFTWRDLRGIINTRVPRHPDRYSQVAIAWSSTGTSFTAAAGFVQALVR